jgi:hypothetical protein
MIQDLFIRRYPQQIYWTDRPTAEVQHFFVQVAHIMFGDLVQALQLKESDAITIGYFASVWTDNRFSWSRAPLTLAEHGNCPAE